MKYENGQGFHISMAINQISNLDILLYGYTIKCALRTLNTGYLMAIIGVPITKFSNNSDNLI